MTNKAYIQKKRGVEPCCPFHDVKAFALPCLSKRATSKAPRRCIYINQPFQLHPRRNTVAVIYNTPREASTVTLFLTNSLGFAKFLHRQNQSVQVNALYICMTIPSFPVDKQEQCRMTMQSYEIIWISQRKISIYPISLSYTLLCIRLF